LKNSDIKAIVQCVLSPALLRDDAWTAAPLNRADRWLYTICTRLLWSYAENHDSTGTLKLAEPQVGGPLPIYWKGRQISQDLANSALELSSISRALAGHSPTHILEIGAGYGRTAFVLLNLFPEATYTIVDIEPALTISKWYLCSLFPKERLNFIAADNIDQIAVNSISLAVSISSLQEMRSDQIELYIALTDRVICKGGVIYLKQWTEWKNPLDNFVARFSNYPIPHRWRLLFREAAPVQTKFTQAAWRIED
jgi:putative sugar O-methyltransferase